MDAAKQAEAQAQAGDQFMEGDAAAGLGGSRAKWRRSSRFLSAFGQPARQARHQCRDGAGVGLLQPVTQDESRTKNAVVAGSRRAGQGAGKCFPASWRNRPRRPPASCTRWARRMVSTYSRSGHRIVAVRAVVSALNKLFSGGLSA